jgi:hypothetical protein
MTSLGARIYKFTTSYALTLAALAMLSCASIRGYDVPGPVVTTPEGVMQLEGVKVYGSPKGERGYFTPDGVREWQGHLGE